MWRELGAQRSRCRRAVGGNTLRVDAKVPGRILSPRDWLVPKMRRTLESRGKTLVQASSEADVRSCLSTLRPMLAGRDLMRIGGANDGGYLIPNDLSGIVRNYSPGVGWTTGYEDELLRRFGIESWLMDVDAPRVNPHPITHAFLGASTTSSSITLTDWVESLDGANQSDLMLSMDIEGDEYAVLLATSSSVLSRFRIMSIEFHFLEQLACKFSLQAVFQPTFSRILQSHQVVHAHANNVAGTTSVGGFAYPRVLELTFLRRDRMPSRLSPAHLPNVVDDAEHSTPA